jgi:2,3-bisphosphoglycerate-independent phosphoglycerate mutase
MEHKTYKKVALVILDGFGVAPPSKGNAVTLANTPTLDMLVQNYPCFTIQASGPLVGLPWGEMGNSEVGHLNIGAGRIVGQDLPRISTAISTGDFYKNKTLLEAVDHCKKNNSALHILGLVSPGGVHALDEHFYALLELAHKGGLKNVFVHMFTDGRDTEPKIALESIRKLKVKMQEIGVGKIATITGRFYAMDRGGHWGQIKLTLDALVKGLGETAVSAEDCVLENYAKQIFDETIKPTVILDEEHKPTGVISNNDAVIFANFRSDRALELTQAFVESSALPEKIVDFNLENLCFVTMTAYRENLNVKVAFEPQDLKNNLGQLLSEAKLSQFHIAESEKFAHVTAFFNCGRSEPWPGEERVIVSSPENDRNYLDKPEMSAGELTQTLVKNILEKPTNFFLANYANTDMVGHTGSLKAATEAVEFLDQCLKKVVEAVLKVDGALIITADHGNAEQMISSKTGGIDKDHTTNPIPFILVAKEFQFKKPLQIKFANMSAKTPAGVICDVAPTVLDLLYIKKPIEMTGISMLELIDPIPKHI